MKKWWIAIGLGVPLLSLLLLLTGFYSLLATEKGTRWLLDKATEYSGLPIEWSEVHGNLLSTLSIERLAYRECAMHVEVQGLHLQWQPRRLLDRVLRVEQFSASSVTVTPQADCDEPAATGNVLPERIELPVSVQLEQLNVDVIRILQGETEQEIRNLKLSAYTQDDQLQVQLHQLDYTTLQLQTRLSTQLQQPYPLQAELRWRYSLEKQQFEGLADVSGNLHRIHVQNQLQQPYAIDTQLVLHDVLNELRFESQSRWKHIEVILPEGQKLVAREGGLQADGNLQQLDYELKAILDTAQASDIDLQAKGIATTSSVDLQSMRIHHAGASLNVRGNIEYQDSLKASLDVNGEKINPAIWLPDYPGDLRIDTQVGFTSKGNNHVLQLQIRKLEGQLRGYPLQGSGKIHTDLEQIHVDQIQLTLGENRLQATGNIAARIDLQATIDAPRIEQIIPQGSGDLQGSIQVYGPKGNPQIKAALQSSAMNYNDQIQLHQAHVEMDIDGITTQVMDADIRVAQLVAQEQTLKDLHLQLQGHQQQHRLTASLKSVQGTLALRVKGTFTAAEQQWNGVIESLELRDTPLGDWTALQAVQISANAQQQMIQGMCLQQDRQEVCADYTSETSQQKLKLQIKKFNLAKLQDAVRDYAAISGVLHGGADLYTDESGLWKGDVKLHTEQLTLTPNEESGFGETLSFEEMQLVAQLDEQSDVRWNFVSNRGKGVADLQIRALQSVDSAVIMRGVLQVEFPDLVFINPYLNNVVVKQGHARIDIQLNGALREPRLKGTGEISELDFYLPDLGIEYKGGHISLNAQDTSRLILQARLAGHTGGHLDVQGDIILNDPKGLKYILDIQGERFPVMDTLDVKALVSPDLEVEGNSKRMNLRGKLDIPTLHIKLKELPEGVASVSDDEILVSPDGETLTQDKFVVVGNVNVNLGDDARFSGYGLQTDLTGGLKISLREEKPASGQGVLSMRNGRYTALGQNLDISKGDILFSGPLDDPSVDVQIKRTAGDVTITMLISGKASDPQTRLISDPVLSEANKLSYLVTGRGMNSLSGEEGADLTGAALALGLNQSSSVVQEIGTTFGLDTLSVRAGEGGVQSTSLLLGKHLSPRLYISYAKDLFSALGAIQLNYRITDHIEVEVESGARQTVDLIYSIKKD